MVLNRHSLQQTLLGVPGSAQQADDLIAAEVRVDIHQQRNSRGVHHLEGLCARLATARLATVLAAGD